MDVFYEESAVNRKAKRGEKTYKVLHYVSWVCFIITVLFAIITIMMIPIKPKESNYAGAEDFQAALGGYSASLTLCLILVSITLFFLTACFILFRIKRNVNINYDYIFVSGELWIAKVFNVNKRKLVERINCEDILQIGDVDNSSYDRLAYAPDVKVVSFTQNQEPAEDKFFMYIFANIAGKKLYVLECRESLLMNILKFTRRSVLESDYVMQEKKKKTV